MTVLTKFEKQVLDACLVGDDPKLAVLRLQADSATVASREHTGVGAYITFSVPDSAPHLESSTFIIGDVNPEVFGVPAGVATLLYAYEGKLQFLEFATYDGEWPQAPEIASIGYLQEVQVAADAFTLVPVKERHPETLARALKGSESRGAA